VILRGRYELGEILGEGAFGKTHAAKDRETHEEVVVKELRIKGLPDWKPVEHFEREVKVLRALEHPGVPRLVDAFEESTDDGLRLYIVAERIPGETLAEKIERGDRWDEPSARALFTALLETLAYLHGLSPRVIHRDIKPGNIVVRPDGRPVLVDFGAVRDLATPPQAGGLTVLGTPGYMAPEQSLGSADARSDLYGLGATMLHVLTHRHPTELPRDELRFRFEDLVGVSKTFVDVLARLVEPDPGQRFQGASSALDALQGRVPALPEPRALVASTEPSALALPSAPRAITPAVARKISLQHAFRRKGGRVPMMMGIMAAILVAGVSAGLAGPAIMPLMLGSIFAMALVFAGARRNRDRGLYSGGAHTMGRLISARHRQQGVDVEYEYTVGGTRFAGSMYTGDVMVVNALRPDMTIVVFYDPGRPHDHVAFLEPELAGLGEG
jgi:hypothetical protein